MTRDQDLAGMEAVIRAARAGERIQRRYLALVGSVWTDMTLENECWDFTSWEFRAKPKCQTVELTAGDIKPGTWVRRVSTEEGFLIRGIRTPTATTPTANPVSTEEAFLITGISPEGVTFGGIGYSWESLRQCLISVDLAHWTLGEKVVPAEE